MIRFNYIIFIVFFLLTNFIFGINSLLASPKTAVQEVEETIDLEQKASREGMSWEEQEALLLQEIQHNRMEAEWYKLQSQSLERYLETAKKNVAELNVNKIAIARVEISLEEVLLETVQNLEDYIKKDLPFLIDERQNRIEFLKISINDYELTIDEKLRRVIEALQVENGYAKDVEVHKDVIETATGSQSVMVVRIGRVGIFALAPNAELAWQYTAQGYIELAPEYLKNLESIVAKNENQLAPLPFMEAK